MKKHLAVIMALGLVMACSAKPKSSEEFLYGSRLYNVFQDYYLKGEPELADSNFFKAEAQFQKVDSQCNLSRIYIGRYVLDETNSDSASLELAKKYADLDQCTEEQQTVAYLSGKPYDEKKLPEPYKSINGLTYDKLVSLAKSDKFDDVTNSRLLRIAAIQYIINNPAQAEDIAQEALKIDKYNGWSLNILRDLILVKVAMEKQNMNTADIETRINLVKLQMVKK